jgi:quercetin dioxygenase-like cupin family protein
MNGRQAKAYSYIPAGEGDRQAFDWGEICWTVSGARGNSDTMTFGRVVIKAGQSNPGHSHGNCDEVLYLVTGKLEHWVGEESFIMEPGDTLFVPKGSAHRAHAIGHEDAVMVVAYSSAERQIQQAK